MNGFLEAVLTTLAHLRKVHSQFPVVTWPNFVELLRKEVNPLAGEAHCRQLIQQLQLMGEVVYLKGDISDCDYVVLNPNYLCSEVLGSALSVEFLRRARPTGLFQH